MDQNLYNDEEEIDLKELLWAVLAHWRGIIVAALVCALLGGAYSWYKSGKDASEADAAKQDQAYTIEEQTEAYEAAYGAVEAGGIFFERSLADQQAYFEESLLMGLDYTNVASTTTDYALRLDSYLNDKANLLLLGHALQTNVYDEAFLTAQAERLDTEPAYLRELISTSRLQEDTVSSALLVNGDAELTRDNYYAFSVTVIGADNAFTEDLSAAIAEHLKAFASDGLEAYVPFGLQLSYVFNAAAPVSTISVDNTVNTSQVNARTNYSNEIARLGSLNTNKTNVKNLEPKETDEESSGRRVSPKWIVLGLMGGVFAGMCVFAATHILSTRLKASPSAQGRFGVRILGMLPEEGKSTGTPFDRWIADKLQGLNAGLTEGQVIDMAAANVATIVAPGASVLVTSSIDDECVAACASQLTARVKAMGTDATFVWHPAFLRNAEANRALQDADVVILVEEAGESRNDAISATVEKITLLNKSIIGMVIA